MSRNISELSGRKGLKNNLFERMGTLAETDGAPDPKALSALAEEFLVGTAIPYGASTFYDFTKKENQGKKVYVCNGSACHNAGTQEGVHKALKTHFAAEEIGGMTCLGLCYQNSAFHFAGKNHVYQNAEQLQNLFTKKSHSKNAIPVYSIGTQVLTSLALDAQEIHTALKSMYAKSKEEILNEIKQSGLRGRGGAGFPIADKLRFCAQEKSDVKFIICNADEGDPGAFSDRYLMEDQSWSLIFGMIAAGYVTGARHGVLYIRAEYPESIERMEACILKARTMGILQEDNSTEDTFNIKVIKAQGAYICGEETALINSIEGQRPEVRTRPPYPAQSGLFNKPTVVNNVETLCALYYIISKGGNTYAALGTSKSSGTKLVSLDHFFNKPGIHEVEMGTPLSDVIMYSGGGFKSPVKALHIGGPLGGIVPVDKINDLTLDFESFASQGFLLGHASVVCIPQELSMIQYLAHLFEFAAHESCGKCFPCRLGTQRAYEMFSQAAAGKYFIDPVLLDDLMHTLTTGSLCAHGGGIPLPVKNVLQYFGSEIQPYLIHN